MKVDQIDVGTREMQSTTSRQSTSYDRKQTANVGKYAYHMYQHQLTKKRDRADEKAGVSRGKGGITAW